MSAEVIIEREHAALTRWIDGDPSGFLDISDEDVVYFDPFVAKRIDGLAALRDYYEPLRGKIHAERFDLLNRNQVLQLSNQKTSFQP